MAIVILSPLSFAANPEKALQKAREKQRKEMLKQLKKEGWRLLDSSNSLEVVLLEHWAKCDAPGVEEIIGISSRSKSKNSGLQMAINNAFVTYSQQAEQTIQGMMASEISANAAHPESEMDNFYAVYKREIEKAIKGELVKSFSIYRENGDGTYEVQAFYTVNEEKAAQASRKAIENASGIGSEE